MSKTRENSRFDQLKQGASNLNATLQMYFWAFVSNQAKFLIRQKSDVFYDVLTAQTPNPLASQASIEASGAFSVVMRGARVLLIPIQKGLQYYAWYNANKDRDDRFAANKLMFEERKRALEELLQTDEENREETLKKIRDVDLKLQNLMLEYNKRNLEEVAGFKKPGFTLRDGLYLAFDLALLGLAIAGLVYGASITGAAIATAAAVVSGVAASINYGKYLYDARQLRKEKQQVDLLLADVENGSYLTAKERAFIEAQRAKAVQDYPEKNYAHATDLEVLQVRAKDLDNSLLQNIKNRYQIVRKSLGFALTMMSIVSASLVLGGLMLGPVGLPVIAAGVGLGLVTTGIAVGMMIVNIVKKNREIKAARTAGRVLSDVEMTTIDREKITPSDRVIHDRILHAEPAPLSKPIGYVDASDEDETPNPFLLPNENVSRFSILRKREALPGAKNDVEMEEIRQKKR